MQTIGSAGERDRRSETAGDFHCKVDRRGETDMMFARRRVLRLIGGASAAAALAPLPASALDYPTRPVHLVVGFAAGGGADIMARLIGQALSERLGHSFVIENRTGAATNIATEVVVKAAADGYTLLLANSPNAINATLYNNLSFNFIRDLAPIAGIGRVPLVMVVNPALPVTSVPAFIAYSKANAGNVNMGSGGNGAPDHVSGELFKMMASVNLLHVPYRGVAPALVGLLGSQVQVIFATMPSVIEQIRAGKLRALAVTTAGRSPALPDVPTIGEFVPGYEASQWYGLCAPRDTPPDIVAKLNRETNTLLADPAIKARLADLGAATLAGTPDDFGRLIAEETEKWAKVVKFSGAKPE
jgi:tripartite-type tricarboxylate transporter receptor subunit TctC